MSDALARLAAAAQGALDELHPRAEQELAREEPDWNDLCSYMGGSPLFALSPDLARGLVAAVDALRAAEARRDALAAAVRDVGNLIAEHGCSCDCDCTHTTGEHTSACDPCLACRASDVVSPLLSGCAADVVRAGVVRAYLDAVAAWEAGVGEYLPGEDVTGYVTRRDAEKRRVGELHKTMVAALAAAEGR